MYFITDKQLYFNAATMITILVFIYFMSVLLTKLYLRAVIIGKSNISIASWIKTPDGVIQFANDAAISQIFRPVGCNDPVGMTFAQIFSDEVASAITALDEKAVSSHNMAKMSVIAFPDEIGSMYVLKVITEQKNGQETLTGFALPFDACDLRPTLLP